MKIIEFVINSYTISFQIFMLVSLATGYFSQIKLMLKNKNTESFSKSCAMLNFYSAFFHILYYLKHEYDVCFLLRAFFLFFCQFIIIYLCFKSEEENKSEVNSGKKKPKKKIGKKKSKEEKEIENDLKEFKKNLGKNLLINQENDLEKPQEIKKIQEIKIIFKKKSKKSKNLKNFKNLDLKIFLMITGLIFLIYTIIFLFTNNYYFIEFTGFLTCLETISAFPLILKIFDKKNIKGIHFFFLLGLFGEDLFELVYYFIQKNPIWFYFDVSLQSFFHIILIIQFIYFESKKKIFFFGSFFKKSKSDTKVLS